MLKKPCTNILEEKASEPMTEHDGDENNNLPMTSFSKTRTNWISCRSRLFHFHSRPHWIAWVYVRGLKHAARGPHVARLMGLCGPRYHQNYSNHCWNYSFMWYYGTFSYFSGPRSHFFLLVRPASSFFVTLWPAYATEFETPGLCILVKVLNYSSLPHFILFIRAKYCPCFRFLPYCNYIKMKILGIVT